MASELTEIAIPSIAFFIAFLLVFLLAEFFIVLFLNGFIYHHWTFIVDVVIRLKIRHGPMIRFIVFASILIFFGVLFFTTPVLPILKGASPEEKLYALEILLVILLVYRIATRHLLEVNFLKIIHRYLYFYFSTIVAVALVLTVHSQYDRYQKLINAKLAFPVTEKVKMVIENRHRKALLSEFRRQIHNGTCVRSNYVTNMTEGKIIHFIYVTTDPDLSLVPFRQQSLLGSQNMTMGRSCANGKETFLLTDYGQWYWVIEG